MFLSFYAAMVRSYSKWLLLLSLIVVAVFISYAKEIRFNNQFSSLFSVDNEDSQYREMFREVFGADDAVLMALIEADNWSPELFKNLDEITEKLSGSNHFVSVTSISNRSVLYDDDGDIIIAPALDVAHLDIQKAVRLARGEPATSNRLISNDTSSILVVAQLDNEVDRFYRLKPLAELFQKEIRQAFNQQQFNIEFPGIAFTRVAVNSLMLDDLKLLIPAIIAVVAVFIYALFRHVSFIVITLFTGLFAIKGTLATMYYLGDDIDQLTVTFPVLLLVIVVANCVHFFHRYVQELQQGASVNQAVQAVCINVSKAAFLSCVTTAVGFYALLLADMEILRSFGFYLGTGVMFSFLGLLLVIPPALQVFKPKKFTVLEFENWLFLQRLTERLIQKNHRLWVLAFGLILLSVAAFFAKDVGFNYHLRDLLAKDHPQVKAGEFLDKHFAGSLPLEISLIGKPDSFRDIEHLKRMQQLEQSLAEKAIDPAILSLSVAIRSLNEAFTGKNSLPDTDAAAAQLLMLAQSSSDNIVPQLVSDDFSHARIQANISDIGSVEMAKIKTHIEQAAKTIFAGTGIKVRLTGEVPLIYQGMNRLSQELLQSVLFALLVIVLTIWVVFKDWRLALGSVFPNALPIILGVAFYSLTDRSLNPLPGIAFCIAIGVAVDDTVHLFARYKEQLNSGSEPLDAIVETVKYVKGALLSSSLILFMGFMVFLLSNFTWSVQLGLLGGFLVVAALLADIIFTPAILALGQAKREAFANKT